MKKIMSAITFIAVSSILAACGGSGGGSGGGSSPSGPVTSTLSFPLQAGFKSFIANGFSKAFTISDYCSGSGTRTTAPASTGTTFEGVSALSSVTTVTGSYTNCTPASFASSSTGYVDTNYNLLGFNSPGTNYGVWLTPPTIPTSVSVGGTAIAGTETLYTDSTKATGNGRMDASFVIEADTSSTAIVNLISKIYDASSVLIATEQDRYRMTSTGALTPISVDIQYANGRHFLWTYN